MDRRPWRDALANAISCKSAWDGVGFSSAVGEGKGVMVKNEMYEYY